MLYKGALEGLSFYMVRPAGIEPAHMASEANALSPELRAHINEF